MFGPRLSKVFASRSNALWWAAMVLVTAYCVAAEPPSAPEGGETLVLGPDGVEPMVTPQTQATPDSENPQPQDDGDPAAVLW